MKFSFIIPAYNAEYSIKKCIDSVINQDYDDWEIIIIDDGSTDNTYSIIKEYADNDSRIHAYTQNNCGPGVTRNSGILKATGEYIAFLDSDDYIEKRYLSLIYEKINNNDYDVIILDNYFEDINGNIIREENLSKFKNLNKQQLISVQMTGKMPWGGCRKVVKRKLINDNKILFSNDDVGEEALFSFRVLEASKNIGFVCEKTYHYVDYPNSQSKKGKDDPWGPIVDKINNYLIETDLIKKYNKEISSFAYTSLTVSLYRISNNHNFFKAIKLCNRKIKDVKKKYNYDVLSLAMEKRTQIVLLLAKLNLLPCIIIISKIKNYFKHMNKRSKKK